MGESWTDFSTSPPPIVPIKLAPDKTRGYLDSTGKGFVERWVVMVGGGYDPTLNLGRAVFFVDAWTGQTLWRFTDDDFKANMGFSGSGAPSMFPVAGGIAPVDIGDTTLPIQDTDAFFDTATWGDLGGNLWVARFNTPGVIDSTGRVNNWFAARAFEELRRSDDAQYMSASGAGRHEFFYMPAATYDPITRTLRAYLGSGNREQMMTQSASCGTDNLFGCCQAGCSNLTSTNTVNYGACSQTDTFSCVGGLLSHTSTNTCGTSGATCTSGSTPFTSAVNLSWTCPGASATTASGSVSCDVNGLCTVAPVGTVAISSSSFTAPTHNRFYGIVAYGSTSTKMFSDKTTAKTFDKNRFTDVSYSGTCGSGSCTLVNTTQAVVNYNVVSPQITTTTCADGSSKCSANFADPGWYYEYGDRCPLAACNTSPPWTDEKTGSGANLNAGCVMWGGFRPYGVATSSDPCSGNQGVPSVYDYSANYITGTPTGTCSGYASSGASFIASSRSITAAPSGTKDWIEINSNGMIEKKGLSLDSGSPPSSSSANTSSALGSKMYWLEVPQQLHQCRHAQGLTSSTCN
jgi:type IV pilus assembly protein PilY1